MSLLPSRKNWVHFNSGFSLIEIMVVVAIIAMFSMVAMPSISSYFQISLNSTTRDLATKTKEAYHAALLGGKVYRLVYDLKSQQYWVEAGPREVLLDTKETKEKEERRKRFSTQIGQDKTPSFFQLDTSITRKKVNLPVGVTFEDIFNQQSETLLKEGLAYTHFFPHGLTEQTIIHLKDESNHHASLIMTPLMGMTDLYDRYISPKEASVVQQP